MFKSKNIFFSVLCFVIFTIIVLDVLITNSIVLMSIVFPFGSIISILTMVCGLIYAKDYLKYEQLSSILLKNNFIEIAHFMKIIQLYDSKSYYTLIHKFKDVIINKTKEYEDKIKETRLSVKEAVKNGEFKSFDIREELSNIKKYESYIDIVNNVLNDKLTWNDVIERIEENEKRWAIIKYNFDNTKYSPEFIKDIDNTLTYINDMKNKGLNINIK